MTTETTRTVTLATDQPDNTIGVTMRLAATPKGLALSITGEIAEGGEFSSGGQNAAEVGRLAQSDPRTAKLLAIWNCWHLNDSRAGCEHQRAEWNTAEPLEVVTYKLTGEAQRKRAKLLESVAIGAAKGEPVMLDAEGRALILLTDWFRGRFSPPDADSPLSGCFEVRKRETRTAGCVRPEEHPRGLLGKKCDTCGYKYGAAWLYEPLPAEVLADLRDIFGPFDLPGVES